MPDQKISQQPEHVVAVLGTDLLPMVGNTATTPTNYRVQVKNFLNNLQIDMPQTNSAALFITASTTANANAAIQSAGQFDFISNSSTPIVAQTRFGLRVRNIIQNSNSNVTGQFAVADFVLDVGSSNLAPANTFGMLIKHFANSAPRVVAPRAYIGIQEDANTGNATTYLLDIGAGGKTVSANATANAGVIFTAKGSAALSHVLKIRVNGVDMWLLASNVAPA